MESTMMKGGQPQQGSEAADVAMVRQWTETFWNTPLSNRQNAMNIANTLLNADTKLHNFMPGGGFVTGPNEAVEYWSRARTAFPDLKVTAKKIMRAEKPGKYMVRYRVTGTHTGPGMGAPTNKSFEVGGLCMQKIANNKIVKEWNYSDDIGMMNQLGLLPKDQNINMMLPGLATAASSKTSMPASAAGGLVSAMSKATEAVKSATGMGGAAGNTAMKM